REFGKAMPLLVDATRRDPRHFWAWFFLGNCHYELLRFDEAVECYSACVGMIPDPSVAYFAYFDRALALGARGRDSDADADLDRAVAALEDLAPEVRSREEPRPYLERAKLRAKRKDFAGAEEVLTEALAFGTLETRILFE